MSRFPRHRKYGEEWGVCSVCGFDVPVSRLRYDNRYGWQCTGLPGANCADPRPDRDDYLRTRRIRLGEGARTSRAPVTNTLTEGGGNAGGAQTGYGYDDYGESPYGGTP